MRRTRILTTLMGAAAIAALTGAPARADSAKDNYTAFCAKCHGPDALGRDKRPSLRSDRVQKEATEGDLAWLLKNGNLGKGMPTWDTIPEPSRWES